MMIVSHTNACQHILSHSLLIGVTVNWEQPEYSVFEGERVEVCAIVSESTAIPFILDIVLPTTEGNIYFIAFSFVTSSHALADFNFTSEQLMFAAGQGPQTVCTTVNIIRDDVLEEEEIHDISLSSNEIDVIIGAQSVTQLVITNFDGMGMYTK